MSTSFIPTRISYTIDCGEPWASREEYDQAIKEFRFRWFYGAKADRALDFDWSIVLDRRGHPCPLHREMVLMKRSWESLRLLIPDKANWRKLAAERKKKLQRSPK